MVNLLKVLRSVPVAIILAGCITPIAVVFSVISLSVFWLVLFLYKQCVICVARLKFSDAKILTKLDGSMSMGTEYTSTTLYICVANILKGHISVEDVKKQLTHNFNKRNPNGEVQNPAMQYYVDYFGGYTFYRKIKNFDPANYARSYKEVGTDGEIEMVDKLKLIDIYNKLQTSTFGKKCPLWEMVVVNNYRHNNSTNDPECSIIIFKFSHTLCDGFGAANYLYKDFVGFPLDLPKVDKSAIKYQCWKYVNLLQIPLFCFTSTFKWVMDSIHDPAEQLNVHAWHKTGLSKIGQRAKLELWLPEPISKNTFREIKSKCNVSTVSIIANVITGGMRRMMLAKNLEVPKDMRIFFPLPKVNHPGTMTNHTSGVVIRLPLWIADCKERLQATEKMTKEYGFGVERFILDFFCIYGNILPNCLKQRYGYDILTSAIISCLPLPSKQAKWLGRELVSTSYFISADRTHVGCMICILGLQDYFHMTIQMNSEVLNQPDEVKDLEKYMLEELDFMGQMCSA